MPPPSEELPIEEVDDVKGDYNARAWHRILIQRAKRMQPGQLADFLTSSTVENLVGMKAMLTEEADDAALLDAIVAEMARRQTGG